MHSRARGSIIPLLRNTFKGEERDGRKPARSFITAVANPSRRKEAPPLIPWLAKRLIKNYRDTADQKVRTAYGTLGTLTGIAVNVLLSAAKFLLGTLSGSLAITADAVNNLSDAAGSVMALISVRLAEKPHDREHPFGHGRMEYIGALAVGALIVLAGGKLL